MASPAAILAWPFWNSPEHRVRALWRFTVFIVLLAGTEFLASRLRPGATPYDTLLWGSAVRFVLSALLVAACTRLLDRRGFDVLGWTPSPRWWGDLAFGAFLGAALISGVVAVEWAAGWLTPAAPREGSLVIALLKALALFTAAGAAEEFVFRSYMLRNLADGLHHRAMPPVLALAAGTLLSSAFFGLVHWGNPNATLTSTVNITLAGIFLAAGYVLTGRLAVPLGLHLTWNYFQGPVFGLPVSGIDVGRSVFAFTQGGPTAWTGGSFGIEGGLLGLLAMVVGTLAIVAWVRFQEGRVGLATDLLFPRPEPVAALASASEDESGVPIPNPAPGPSA